MSKQVHLHNSGVWTVLERREYWKLRSAAAAVALILGAVLFVWGSADFWRQHASTYWPTTQGEVLDSQLGGAAGGWSTPDEVKTYIDYKYAVGGIVYRSQQYAFWGFGSFKQAEEIIRSHPMYARITVYYNPDDPAQAVLAPGAGPWPVAMTLTGLFLLVLGAGLFIAARRANESQPAADTEHPTTSEGQ